MYMRNNSSIVEFLKISISFGNGSELVSAIRPVSLMSTADSVSINDRLYRRINILYGSHHETTRVVASLKFITQKLAFGFETDAKSAHPNFETPYSFTIIQTLVKVGNITKIIFVLFT
jgi:hypothetical protein